MNHHCPTPIVIEDSANLDGYHLIAVNHMICSVYGDHLHRNDAPHLECGVTNDVVLQH